jgi:hypothetical protein
MTTLERKQEDEAEAEYIRQWQIKKASRKHYKVLTMEALKWAWKYFKKYVKGSVSE